MYVESFEMERFQSFWENIVDYNLSESGVHPLNLKELVNEEELKNLLQVNIGYNQTNGTEKLRDVVASLYPKASVDNVLITNGSSEANFISTWNLIESDDELALMLPNYMQIWGIGKAFGAKVNPFHMVVRNGNWQIDWDEFDKSISSKTNLIAVCNPNNPTGAQLNENEITIICEKAAEVDAWILSDEVYRGAERVGDTTPTFWGNYEKVIVISGLSKAYGLPGLRIGWIIAPPELVEKLWSYHDYTTICPNPLSDYLARIALDPINREKILERTRNIIKGNFQILDRWLNFHNGFFEYIPPVAGAIALVKYNLKISSLELVTRLRKEKSVLIVPGKHFFMENHLRFGFGCEAHHLQNALERMNEFMDSLV